MALIIMYWRDGQMHYYLLALSPLDEVDQSAGSHCSFIQNILTSFGQSAESLKFLVDNNCATKQRMATLFGVPLVGCASHRFNLAANQYLAKHDDLVAAVAALMTSLQTPKNCAELRQHTTLAPLRANATRWSSTFTMIERYVRIRDAIQRVDAVYNLIPKPGVHRRIVALYKTLKTFNSVCKKLQEDSLTMSSVRVLFDKMTEMYPVTASNMSPDADIVRSPTFESAVVKVAGNCKGDLTPDELDALELLKLSATTEEATTIMESRQGARTRAHTKGEDFATALLRSDTASVAAAPRYSLLVKVVPPTSNRCERLFSQCKLVMTPQRSSLLPVNYEMIEFLRVNCKYRNAYILMDVNVAED